MQEKFNEMVEEAGFTLDLAALVRLGLVEVEEVEEPGPLTNEELVAMYRELGLDDQEISELGLSVAPVKQTPRHRNTKQQQ